MTPEEKARLEMQLRLLELEELEERESGAAGITDLNDPAREATRSPQQILNELPTPLEAAGRSMLEGGRNVLQGASLGTADEIESFIGSVVTDQTYDEYMDDLEGSRKKYRQEHPGATATQEILAGVISPINKLKIFKYGKGKGRSQPTLKRRAANIGRAAAEGAATGYASADRDERERGAITGGAFGGGLGAVGNTVGAVKDFAVRNIGRKADDLVEGGFEQLDVEEGFKSLPLASDNMASSVYRRVIGRAFGGANLQKESKQFERDMEGKLKVFKETEKRMIEEQQEAIRQQRYGVEDTNRTQVNMAQDVEAQARRVADDQYNESLGRIGTSQARRMDAADQTPTMNEMTQRGSEAIDENLAAFRRSMFDESIPPNAPPEFRAQVLEVAQRDPQAANDLVDKYWISEGFNSIKDLDFPVNGKALRDDIKANTPKAQQRALREVQDLIDDIIPTEDNVIAMTGRELMEARNELRMAANAMSNAGGAQALQAGGLRTAAREIDNFIKANIDGDTAKAYSQELKAYGNFQSTLDAVGKAGTTAQGMFKQADILQAERSFSNKNFATGRTSQRIAAQSGQRQIAETEKGLSKSLDKLKADQARAQRHANEVAEAGKAAIGSRRTAAKEGARSVLVQTRKKLKEGKTETLRGLDADYRGVRKGMMGSDISRQIEETEGQLRTVRDRQISASKGTVDTLGAQAMLMAPFLMMGIPPVASGAISVGVAKFASRQDVQRFLAGQGGVPDGFVKGFIEKLEPLQRSEFIKSLPAASRRALTTYMTGGQ